MKYLRVNLSDQHEKILRRLAIEKYGSDTVLTRGQAVFEGIRSLGSDKTHSK